MALVVAGVLLQPIWGSDVFLTAGALAVLTFAYGIWPGRISVPRFGKKLYEAFVTLLGLVSFTVAVLAFGRLIGSDFVTALAEMLAGLLAGGG